MGLISLSDQFAQRYSRVSCACAHGSGKREGDGRRGRQGAVGERGMINLEHAIEIPTVCLESQ